MSETFETRGKTTSICTEDELHNIPEIKLSGKRYKKSDYKLLIIRIIFRIMNKIEEYTIKQYHGFKSYIKLPNQVSWDIPWLKKWKKLRMIHLFRFCYRLPFIIMYWIYIAPFLFICQYLWINAIDPVITILCKKSELVSSIVEHVVALVTLAQRVKTKITTERPSELVRFFITTLQEIIVALLNPAKQEIVGEEIRDIPIVEDSSELVHYEEFDVEDETLDPNVKRRSLRGMHNYVPAHLFRATVRVNHEEENAGAFIVKGKEQIGADSPASFPSTPFSRAYVMNRTAERVVSVIFAARDRLRLEAQSVSRDEVSRMIAKENQSTGQFAIFDPRQTSNGITLTCGNHCAMKIGNALCCSCRSMIFIRPDTYVYFEYSITASSAQVPSLGLGLSPVDCPLNVMVGSWPSSVGFYTDGQVMISSQWFPNLSSSKVGAGTTVGMLVYIPSSRDIHKLTSSSEMSNLPLEVLQPESNLPPPVDKKPSHNELAETLSIQPKPEMLLKFNVNGIPVAFSKEVTDKMAEIGSAKAPLYPTVSLFSENTRVWGRFCEADIVFRSRTSMQAPTGVRVYCLDGSLLLDENE